MSKYPNPSGKRSIVFNRSDGFVDKPITIPCGGCIGCRIDKSRMWALRCVHEAKQHKENCFLTLTYNDDHLPENGVLVKSDLQKFFKRLRKAGYDIRYYACGEYGDINYRPHYHVLLFGTSFLPDRRRISGTKPEHMLFTSETLSKFWPYGNCTIGIFNYQTAAYVARYVMKKITGKLADDYYRMVNVSTGEEYQLPPEFACMSLRPAIGLSWFDKHASDAFPSDFLIHDGKKHSVPRYYTDKLKLTNEVLYKKIKTARKRSLDLCKVDNTPDRLAVREECKRARISQLRRSV